MELGLLEDFICLSDVRNFSRAAEMRNISQSTLSKHIRRLEHWVGAPLIDRSSYPIRLTTEGQLLIGQARDLANQFHNLRTGIRAVSRQGRDQINILAMHTLRLTFLPGWLQAIEARIGRIEQTPTPALASYSDTVRMFRNDECDLLASYAHPSVQLDLDLDDLDRLVVGHDRILPLSAPDRDGRPLHDLDRGEMVRYLSYGTQTFFAQLLTRTLNEGQLVLNTVAVNPMSIALQSLALVGSGMAWIPESLAHDAVRSGALVLAGNPDWIIETDIVICRKRRNRRPVVTRVWQAACALNAEGAPG